MGSYIKNKLSSTQSFPKIYYFGVLMFSYRYKYTYNNNSKLPLCKKL